MSRKVPSNSIVSKIIDIYSGNYTIYCDQRNFSWKSLHSKIYFDDFKSNFMFSGRFKIGHRQISNSYISNNLKIHSSIGQ